MLDAYTETPGHERGFVERGGGLTLERSAAVKRILSRARKWGPLLRGAQPSVVPGVDSPGGAVRVTLFTRGQRRFVLVWNPASDRFVRSTVEVASDLGGQPARRAVEVAAEPGRMGGGVFQQRRGKIALDVDLAPGNASLFELF
jgi:hypothetical protein